MESQAAECDQPENAAAEVTFIPYNPSPEFLQRKMYFLIEQLKIMHSELPENYQMRIPYEELTALANCLVNDTVFEIVRRLTEIQHVNEGHLLEMREQVVQEHQNEINIWKSKIQDSEELAHIVHLMHLKHCKQLKEKDMELVLHLDESVTEQQRTLRDAGVPGFFVTDQPKEIKLQMFRLDFILRLSRMKYDSAGRS